MYTIVIHLTPTNIAILFIFACAAFNCLAKYLYTNYRLVFGTLYPAYSSYKAIKRKDVKEYTRWMMYWVCYGMFSAAEFVTDIFFSFWFPFYYETKILFIMWLMSPYGNGAKILYKTVIHPELNKREKKIDFYIERATKFGFQSLKLAWLKLSETVNDALLHGIRYAINSLSHQDRPDGSFGGPLKSSGFWQLPAPDLTGSSIRIFDDESDIKAQAKQNVLIEEMSIDDSSSEDSDDDQRPRNRYASCTRLDSFPSRDNSVSSSCLEPVSFKSRSSSSFCLNESFDASFKPRERKLRRGKERKGTDKEMMEEEIPRPRRKAAINARLKF